VPKTWKRLLIHALDNNAGRPVLKRLATMQARKITRLDVTIDHHNGFWNHRVGEYYVPDRASFDYYEPTLLAWKDEIPAYFQAAQDFWFRYYRPRAGDVVIDVGAGRGESSLPFAKAVGSKGKVFAIEAHPRTWEHLQRFCKLNNLANVVAVQCALMDRDCEVLMEDCEVWETNSVGVGNGAVQVAATTLDQICQQYQLREVAFLKMNIEGAESLALLGMKESIKRVQTMCICCHDFRAERGHGEQFRTRSFVSQFLNDHGFALLGRPDDARDYVRDHIFAFRES
jgi:FkbM family methyltransferase